MLMSLTGAGTAATSMRAPAVLTLPRCDRRSTRLHLVVACNPGCLFLFMEPPAMFSLSF